MQSMMKTGASVISRFDKDPFSSDEDPVNISDIVDPSAAAVDPTNEKFVPSNKKELKLSVLAALTDLEDVEIPKVYDLIKKSIQKLRDKEQEMKDKNRSVEESIRHNVRKILLSEYWEKDTSGKLVWKGSSPAPKIAQSADITKFNPKSAEFIAAGKGLKASSQSAADLEGEELKSAVAGKADGLVADIIRIINKDAVKQPDPANTLKKVSRYLKDNTPGKSAELIGSNFDAAVNSKEVNKAYAAKVSDLANAAGGKLHPKNVKFNKTAGQEGTARSDIEQALDLSQGEVRAAEESGLAGARPVAFSLPIVNDALIKLAADDFIDCLEDTDGLNGVFTEKDIKLLKLKPEQIEDLASFRYFLQPYKSDLLKQLIQETSELTLDQISDLVDNDFKDIKDFDLLRAKIADLSKKSLLKKSESDLKDDDYFKLKKKPAAYFSVAIAIKDFLSYLKETKGLKGTFSDTDIAMLQSEPAILKDLKFFKVFAQPYKDKLTDPNDPELRLDVFEEAKQKLESEVKKLGTLDEPSDLDIEYRKNK